MVSIFELEKYFISRLQITEVTRVSIENNNSKSTFPYNINSSVTREKVGT